MNSFDILHLRLYNQLLIGSDFTHPQEIVAWMGAMQAQNYEMAKWGVAVRLPHATNRQVEEALNDGKILRTHILRPTWHFVTPEDIHWMRELTSSRIKSIIAGYAREYGTDDALIKKSLRVLPKILEEHGHLTREEIGKQLVFHGVKINDAHHVSNVMSFAEQEGIVCSGKVSGNKQTYALLHEWAPKTFSLSREEALERLIRRYFTSHGPATLEDCVWWSGLTMTDVRRGLESIRHNFICETFDGKQFWMRSEIKTPPAEKSLFHLLPAFDEFVVSYKERSEIIDEAYYRKILTKNGIFSPTIHYNGKIIGSWKRISNKNKTTAELSFFETTPKKIQGMFGKEIDRYSGYATDAF